MCAGNNGVRGFNRGDYPPRVEFRSEDDAITSRKRRKFVSLTDRMSRARRARCYFTPIITTQSGIRLGGLQGVRVANPNGDVMSFEY